MDSFTYEMLDLPDGTSVPILGLDDPTWDDFGSRFANSSFTVRPVIPVGSPSAAGLDAVDHIILDAFGSLPVTQSSPNMDIVDELVREFFGTSEVQDVSEVQVSPDVPVPTEPEVQVPSVQFVPQVPIVPQVPFFRGVPIIEHADIAHLSYEVLTQVPNWASVMDMVPMPVRTVKEQELAIGRAVFTVTAAADGQVRIGIRGPTLKETLVVDSQEFVILFRYLLSSDCLIGRENPLANQTDKDALCSLSNPVKTLNATLQAYWIQSCGNPGLRILRHENYAKVKQMICLPPKTISDLQKAEEGMLRILLKISELHGRNLVDLPDSFWYNFQQPMIMRHFLSTLVTVLGDYTHYSWRVLVEKYSCILS